jgi:glycosyltransferase involved in cell wall biosynthesis
VNTPTVHIVLPNDIDDPAAPSGGNFYDRRVCDGLAALGWDVREHAARGAWPQPTVAERADLARLLAGFPAGSVVVVDGLIASTVAEVLVPERNRLRLVVLAHMAFENAGEDEALEAACAIIATSAWTRRRLIELYGLPEGRIHVATPGVDAADPVPGSADGNRLLSVAAVAPHKGHDLLLEALARVADVPWTCVLVGSLTRDPAFVSRLRRQLQEYGLTQRVELAGARTGAALDAAYAVADLLVLATRGESYGMVVTEALARGIPVLTTAVGGLPEAMGQAPDGNVPGLLVDVDDPAAITDGFASALRRWLCEPDLREDLRRAAAGRRSTLGDWSSTAETISKILHGASTPLTFADWLALREPADAAARARSLVAPLRNRLAATAGAGPSRIVIHDLGAGTGAMGRWLAPQLPGPQHWIMYDRDADLLERAAVQMVTAASDGSPVTVETRLRDVTRLTRDDLAGASLITASALLDLLTAEELDRVVAACAAVGCPTLVTLSVIGRVEITPADPLDDDIAEAFNAHQRRTHAGRPLLGADAIEATVEAFGRRGIGVQVESSPWELGANQAQLVSEWLTSWLDAAYEQRSDLVSPTAVYAKQRMADAAAGRLRAVVHHRDVLANCD